MIATDNGYISDANEPIGAENDEINQEERKLDPTVLFNSLAKVLRQPQQFIIKKNKMPARYMKSPYAIKL